MTDTISMRENSAKQLRFVYEPFYSHSWSDWWPKDNLRGVHAHEPFFTILYSTRGSGQRLAVSS